MGGGGTLRDHLGGASLTMPLSLSPMCRSASRLRGARCLCGELTETLL